MLSSLSWPPPTLRVQPRRKILSFRLVRVHTSVPQYAEPPKSKYCVEFHKQERQYCQYRVHESRQNVGMTSLTVFSAPKYEAPSTGKSTFELNKLC